MIPVTENEVSSILTILSERAPEAARIIRRFLETVGSNLDQSTREARNSAAVERWTNLIDTQLAPGIFAIGVRVGEIQTNIGDFASDDLMDSFIGERRALYNEFIDDQFTQMDGMLDDARGSLPPSIVDVMEIAKYSLSPNLFRSLLSVTRARLEENSSPSITLATVNQVVMRLRATRAESIAASELASAHAAAIQLLVERAVSAGRITPPVTRAWIVNDDERLCPICAPLEGETSPLTGTFGDDRFFLPPAHPHCRCVVRYTGGALNEDS